MRRFVANHFRWLPLTAAAALAAGCASDEEDPPPHELLAPPPAGEGLQLALDVELAPGEETEVCQYVVLPDDGPLDITRFEHAYSRGSHHLLLYQTDRSPDQVDDSSFPCAGASFESLGVVGVAYAAQVPEGEQRYPDGVALPMAAGEVVLLQSHYLNASEEPVSPQVRLNLWLAPEPAPVKAGTLFFYDWAILVPQNEAATAQMRCRVPEDVELLFAMSHMHRRGVGYRSWQVGGELEEPQMLFTTTAWEGVEPALFQPTRTISAGQRIDFECDYQGEPGRTIVEGPSAEDNEMCMFIAAYYPRLDEATEQCRGPGSGPVFEGDRTCGETLACVQGTDDPVEEERCMLDTCEPSADAARDLFFCVFDRCQADCEDERDPACQACVNRECQGELGACLNASCG